MDKASSLSSSSARSSLEDSSESSEKDKPQSGANKDQPKLTQGRARAGTWTSAPAPTSPRGAHESSSTPKVVHRGLQRQATVSTTTSTGSSSAASNTQSSGNANSNTTTSTATATTTTTTSATTSTTQTSTQSSAHSVSSATGAGAPKKETGQQWRDLSEGIRSIVHVGMQKGGSLTGKALGKLLVFLESGGGKKTPEVKQGGAPVMRAGQIIMGYRTDEGAQQPGRTINVIEEFLSPFLGKNLQTPEMEEARKQVQKKFEASRKQLDSYDTSSLRPAQILELEGYKDAMTQVIKPLLDCLFGRSMKLKETGLNQSMKDLLLSIDTEIVKWINKKGPKDLEEQFLFRRSALVSILGVRGISLLWKQKFDGEKKDVPEYFRPLNSFILATLNQKLDRLYVTIMLENKEQSKEIKALLKGKAMREQREINSLQTPRGKEADLKKKFTRIFSGETTAPEQAPRTPRDPSLNARSMMESENRKTKVERTRAADLNAFAKDLKLAEFSPEFMRQLKNRVTTSRDEFKKFKDARAKYCLEQITAYANLLTEQGKPVPQSYQTILKSLNKWAAEEVSDEASDSTPERQILQAREPSSKQASASQTTAQERQKSEAMAASTTGPTVFSTPASVKLDLSGLKSSPFVEGGDSEQTEPSSSSEVGTEESSS
jgi:hypothetical protein